MGVDHHEPSSCQVLENTPAFQASRTLFSANGWFLFFNHFNGYDDKVSLHFAKTFDGNQARIGDLTLLVSDQSISKATGLPMEGKKWIKKGRLTRAQINHLLKPEFHTVKLGKGFPRYYLHEEWKHVLFILQQFMTFMTGEGQYILTF